MCDYENIFRKNVSFFFNSLGYIYFKVMLTLETTKSQYHFCLFVFISHFLHMYP